MKPCQKGYPCKYALYGTCVQPQCHIVRDGDTVTDTLTGEVTEWVTVVKKKPKKDPLDQWYDDWLGRNGFKTMMESANTYEREHGRIKQKRHAR